MHCPYCNQEHSETDKFCLVTGLSLANLSICPQCGRRYDSQLKACPYCSETETRGSTRGLSPLLTTPAGEAAAPPARPPALQPKTGRCRLKILMLILLPLLLLAALLTGLVFTLRSCQSPNTEPTPTIAGEDGVRPEDTPPEPEPPLSTLPSPLAGLDFPTEPIAYPPDWPAELLFPPEFLLVEASSGSIPPDSPTGWSAGLRFPGTADQAVKQLTAFFTDHGWTVEANPMASGATLLLIEKNDGESQGLLVIAAAEDNPAQAHILATLFP